MNRTLPDSGDPWTVLLIEDDRTVRELTSQILTLDGFQVLQAPHGVQALEICDEFSGPIHLTLSDVFMPLINGPQLYERLVTRRPEMRVLYMSGYPVDAVYRPGVVPREAPFISKPFRPDNLVAKVREVLATPGS